MKKLTYCFEQEYVANTLKNTAVHGLAVVDTEGCESAVRDAVKRGVWVYGRHLPLSAIVSHHKEGIK